MYSGAAVASVGVGCECGSERVIWIFLIHPLPMRRRNPIQVYLSRAGGTSVVMATLTTHYQHTVVLEFLGGIMQQWVAGSKQHFVPDADAVAHVLQIIRSHAFDHRRGQTPNNALCFDSPTARSDGLPTTPTHVHRTLDMYWKAYHKFPDFFREHKLFALLDVRSGGRECCASGKGL